MLDPERTIAIVSGAKEWPNLDNFEAAPAFANSAVLIRRHLTSKRGLGLPKGHTLWLFNKPGAVAQYQLITNFLRRQFTALGSPRGKDVLILFFYVGHGAFLGSSSTYCLLVQDTLKLFEAETSLQVASLARLFRSQAAESQRMLFLDCCFAGEAAKLFQGGFSQVVSTKAREVVEEVPADRGAALLCASSARNPARMESASSYTLFSRELVQALNQGDPDISGPLTLRQLCQLVRRGLRSEVGDDAPNPEVHVPDQEKGDLAAVPLFPNPAWSKLGPISPAEQRPKRRKLLIVEDEIGDTIVDVLEEAGYECKLVTSYGAWKDLRDQGLAGYDGALVDLHLRSRDDAMGMHIIKYLRDSTQIPTAMVTSNPRHTRHHDKHQMLAEYRLVELIDKDDRERYLQDLPATARLLVGTDEQSRRHRLSTWVEATLSRAAREAAEPGDAKLAQDRLKECLRAAQQAQDAIRFGSLNEAQRQVDALCR